jgi:hypothetical protein
MFLVLILLFCHRKDFRNDVVEDLQAQNDKSFFFPLFFIGNSPPHYLLHIPSDYSEADVVIPVPYTYNVGVLTIVKDVKQKLINFVKTDPYLTSLKIGIMFCLNEKKIFFFLIFFFDRLKLYKYFIFLGR